MRQLTSKLSRKFAGLCFLFMCLIVSACGNANNAESTQPDPGLNAEGATADLDKTKK
ncbi:hypothetical protein Pan241w_02470 [Gimesia alba]|uniref:Uncharacterized protein n=1 Tax=Gimesia alba TaxID=2527973 RepID=A0A517R8L2_9PLAN|nr:hypothetical protein Pan241w_02470 [Gimesia alba]